MRVIWCGIFSAFEYQSVAANFFLGPSVMNCIMVMCRFRNDTIWNDMKNVVVLLPHLPPMSTTFFFSLFFFVSGSNPLCRRNHGPQNLAPVSSARAVVVVAEERKKTNFFFWFRLGATIRNPERRVSVVRSFIFRRHVISLCL